MGDGNEHFCTFPGAASREVDAAILSYYIVRLASRICYDVATEMRSDIGVALAFLSTNDESRQMKALPPRAIAAPVR